MMKKIAFLLACTTLIAAQNTVQVSSATPSFSVLDASVNESAGTLRIGIYKAGGNTANTTVAVREIDGTAKAGIDYTQIAGNVTFRPNDSVKFVNIPIINDSIYKGNRTFYFNITPKTTAVINRGTAAITIIEDDPKPVTPPPPPPPPPTTQTCPDGTVIPSTDTCPPVIVPPPIQISGFQMRCPPFYPPTYVPSHSACPSLPPIGTWTSAPLVIGGYARIVTAQPGWPLMGIGTDGDGEEGMDYDNSYRPSIVGEVCKIIDLPGADDVLTRPVYGVKCLFDGASIIVRQTNVTGVAPANGYTPPF